MKKKDYKENRLIDLQMKKEAIQVKIQNLKDAHNFALQKLEADLESLEYEEEAITKL